MGAPRDVEAASQVAYEYTSTKSIFTIEVDDKVSMKVTFLSPLTPDDFRRQSLVFSYMNVEVSSLDGSNHDVELYTDISAGTYLRHLTTWLRVLTCPNRVGFGGSCRHRTVGLRRDG